MKRSILLALFACLVAGPLRVEAVADDAARSANPPNIVFVFTDDHRWDGLGALPETN